MEQTNRHVEPERLPRLKEVDGPTVCSVGQEAGARGGVVGARVEDGAFGRITHLATQHGFRVGGSTARVWSLGQEAVPEVGTLRIGSKMAPMDASHAWQH